jgi:hypothetical protein
MLASRVGEVRIARDDGVGNTGHRGEATQPPAVVEPFWRVRVSQKDGIIDVEEQAADATAQRAQLPRGKETPLEKDRIGVAQVGPEPESSPKVGGEGAQFEVMARRMKSWAERGEAVAAADVVGRVDQCDKMHATVLHDLWDKLETCACFWTS